jgi:chromosome segregation ATPase
LEENQVFAENEISSLADERVRLTDRIAELETEVSEVSKARDEYRNAGVREGKQYVEIVRMASQLELKAAEERRQLVAALAGKNGQARQTSEPGMHMQEAAAGVLENEVRQLRTQCANYELALKDIQQENRRIDDVIATFLSTRAEVEKSLKGVLGREFLQNS